MQLVYESEIIDDPKGFLDRISRDNLRGFLFPETYNFITNQGADRVIESMDIVTSHFYENKDSMKIIPDYETDNVSKKVLRIILSYTDYINRTVWHKNI